MNSDKRGFAVNGDIRIHFVFQGTQNQKRDNTVVLCHGWPEFWYGWRKQIPALAAAGYHVVAPDMRGFGESSTPVEVEKYTWKHITADLVALLDQVNVERGIFIGHDWGGQAVWQLALYHPDRVRAVGSVCTAYTPSLPKFVSLDKLIEMKPVFYYQKYFNTEEAVQELENNVRRLFLCLLRTSRDDDRVGKWFDQNSKTLLQGYHENPQRSPLITEEELDMYVKNYQKSGFRACLNWYRTRELNWKEAQELQIGTMINHPALMVTTGRDRVLTRDMTNNMETYIPQLKRGHIEEAGHWVLNEQPDQINTILIDWLNSLPPSSSL